MEVWNIKKNKEVFKQECKSWNHAIKMTTSPYFVVGSKRIAFCDPHNEFELGIYESTTCKLIRTLNFLKHIRCIANGMDQLLISFSDGSIEFWGGT